MLLHDLLRQFDPAVAISGSVNPNITGVQEDSRLVKPGDLFVARAGLSADGSRFITDAVAKGAVAVVSESDQPAGGLPVVRVKSAMAATSVLAHLLHGKPSTTLKVMGITGTNGKTTTAYLIREILNHVGQKCGMIGTVEIDDGLNRQEATMTTPSAPQIAELMSTMNQRSCRRCAMEVSSHALHQHRVSGVEFAGAGFTNLTGDHLNYHGTMEQYADAKAMLFEQLPAWAVAVTNTDDPWVARMERDCKARKIRFGFGKHADYRAKEFSISAQGTTFELIAPGGRTFIETPLIGKHNIENALLAAALVGEVCGLTVHQIAAGLKQAQGAPGRLQIVRCDQPFAVLVDYAHTDDALGNVLSALRKLPGTRKLRVLFGCGGDRDRTKRPRMAKTAEKWADAIYVTSDNPRTEDPQAILDEICTGFLSLRTKPISVNTDRRAAIEQILADAQPGDVVLIAGKGHENYQIIGNETRHFDDVEEASRVLNGRPQTSTFSTQEPR